MYFIYILLAFLGGAVLPVQIGFNTTIAKATDSPVWASGVSFGVGAVTMFVYFIVSRQPLPAMTAISTIPAYAWIAGALGAIYVTISIIVAPKIGIALLISLVVAGQMTVSLLLDHYGAIGFPPHPVNLGRLAGALLVVGGVVLIKKY